MLNRPGRFSPALLLHLSLIVGSVSLVGCGEERLSDEAYGFIDLAPYYMDGATSGNPTSALPRDLRPQMGWVNGVRAEYYDFGLVGTVKRRSNTSIPDYAVVHPMYFFFDQDGNPMFSRPVHERRTGLWHMRGGKNTKDPNPPDTSSKDFVYSIRIRDLLVDEKRGTADYQRPIVDRIQHNSGDYSGLWEIYKVIAPVGYDPDAIKSYETLQKGIDSGEFQVRRTQKVINCPIVDDRTYITPTAMYYGVPRPRMEIWYRTKQGSCFLIDGWLTLGDSNGRPYGADDALDANRLDTFDIIRYTIGNGNGARTTVVAPVSRMYQPIVRVADQDPARTAVEIPYQNDYLTESLPRLRPSDPPGYRPIRWMWSILVPQAPEYVFGSVKRVDQTDPAQLSARSGGPFTKNFPIIGRAIPCKSKGDPVCGQYFAAPGVRLECNMEPNIDLAYNELPANIPDAYPPDRPDGRLDFVDALQQREGGPRCDVPAVSFGHFCAPGIARCDSTSTDRMVFTAPNAMMPTTVMGRDSRTATAPAEWGGAIMNAAANTNAWAGGYTCVPQATGYCYMRCDGAQMNASSGMRAQEFMIEYPGPNDVPTKRTASLAFDSRCGNIPGFVCTNLSGTHPTQMRACLRQCGTGDPEKFNEKRCALPQNLTITDAQGTPRFQNRDVMPGTSCSNRGISGGACTWDPAFEPRDPMKNFTP